MSQDAPAIDPTKIHAGSAWKHSRPLTACRFDPSGKYVFTGAEDYFVTRWEISSPHAPREVPATESGLVTRSVTATLAAHDSWVRALACSPSGDVLYSGGYDGRLAFWPLAAEKPEPARTIDAHQGWIRALAVSPDGSRVLSCGNDKLVKLWDTADGKLVSELAGHKSHVYNVAFHPTDGTFISCDLKGIVKHWDLAAGTARRDFTAGALYKYDTQFRADIGGARSIAFSTDGKQLALGGITNVTNAFAGIGNPAVVLIDWETGKPEVQYEGKEKINGTAWGVRHHSGGFWIGLSGGGGGGWLYFWRDKTAQEFFKFKLPDTGRDMDLSPDGRIIAVAHADGNLRLYPLHAKPA
jgi:WD40 repeat protein